MPFYVQEGTEWIYVYDNQEYYEDMQKQKAQLSGIAAALAGDFGWFRYAVPLNSINGGVLNYNAGRYDQFTPDSWQRWE